MTTFLEIALVNAVLGAILACVVFTITRIWKNPHLAHVLWLVVLLKMVTPPLVRVPISFGFEWSSGEIASTATEELYTSELASASVAEKTSDLPFESVKASALLNNPPIERPFEPAMSSMEHGTSARPIKAMKTRVMWPFYIGVVWLSGSLLYAFIAGVRTVRFHRRLKEADLADKTLQRMGEAVARAFGLKQCPVLRVTDGHLSPMVWPVSHPPTVVLPLGLVENLQDEQLRTIVAHEYGHIVRRDHWVRWLEIVSTTLYWWHPCMWLVRKEIRMAEELCCDALVVKTYPESSQVFGESLLKIADFLSAIPHGAPILVSEIRGSGQLKRRIEMMLKNKSPRSLSRMAKYTLLMLTLTILPLSAQESQKVQKDEVDSGKLDASVRDEDGRSDTESTNVVKLFIAGADSAKPGVHILKADAVTYGKALKLGGIDVDRMRARGLVAYTIQLRTSDSTVGHSEELGQMLKRAPALVNRQIVHEFDPKALNETLVILWVGKPNRWALFNKATRQSHVIIGVDASKKAAELRNKGIPTKVVNDSKQGQWPPQYDELMHLANKAHLEGRWPRGETWLTNVAEDERVRELIRELLKAVKEGNERSVGKLVSERGQGWAKIIIDEMLETIRCGATPSMIRSIMIGKKDAMVVTDFFDYDEGPKRRGKYCLVYQCVRHDDKWIIRDIDIEDVEGLIEEVSRFDRRKDELQ